MQVDGAGDSKPRGGHGAAERKEKQPRSDESKQQPRGDGSSSQREELTRGSSSGKFLKVLGLSYNQLIVIFMIS